MSRLNRTYPGKEETFVLNFVNEREEILASFQDYYETTGSPLCQDRCRLLFEERPTQDGGMKLGRRARHRSLRD
ncbi:MAG: hypothetical protein KAX51_02955 [Chromatiaceae bacterium]|nr:hypothetical protein [Chromatiaceae bacterium]